VIFEVGGACSNHLALKVKNNVFNWERKIMREVIRHVPALHYSSKDMSQEPLLRHL
jgi:hypothetical protein